VIPSGAACVCGLPVCLLSESRPNGSRSLGLSTRAGRRPFAAAAAAAPARPSAPRFDWPLSWRRLLFCCCCCVFLSLWVVAPRRRLARSCRPPGKPPHRGLPEHMRRGCGGGCLGAGAFLYSLQAVYSSGRARPPPPRASRVLAMRGSLLRGGASLLLEFVGDDIGAGEARAEVFVVCTSHPCLSACLAWILRPRRLHGPGGACAGAPASGPLGAPGWVLGAPPAACTLLLPHRLLSRRLPVLMVAVLGAQSVGCGRLVTVKAT
jgi:hypothetical protein